MVTQYHLNQGVAHAMNSANAQYLAATFDAIRSRYGSVDHYLEAELGLTPERREQLKNKFLTN
jgi:protein-tyrosine phosphatase